MYHTAYYRYSQARFWSDWRIMCLFDNYPCWEACWGPMLCKHSSFASGTWVKSGCFLLTMDLGTRQKCSIALENVDMSSAGNAAENERSYLSISSFKIRRTFGLWVILPNFELSQTLGSKLYLQCCWSHVLPGWNWNRRLRKNHF